MSDPGPLLIPIETKAMVVNNTAMNFIRAQMNYNNVANLSSPSPNPFQEDDPNFATDLRNHGVYFMWTLPRALRHGTQNADGVLTFPFVPNRWLVIRLFRPATDGNVPPSGEPQLTAWMVQSDFLANNNNNGTSAFVDPTQTSLTPTWLGQKVPITSSAPWQEPSATTAYFLRAVAESNPAFAAYQPFNENVFSIHDDLWTQNIPAGTLSYYVQGWYSDPAADVLGGWQTGIKGNDFSDVMARLGWTVPAASGGTKSGVYHGAAFGVSWTPNAPQPPPSPKDGAKPLIAVGNTSVDAVVAFAAAAFNAPNVTPPSDLTPQQAINLLEAFQYNLLPLLSQPGGDEVLEQAIRTQWFGSAAAGTSWMIVDAPVAPGTPPPPPLPDSELEAEATWLAALNSAQTQFDNTIRSLMGVQRRLFELWWKQQDFNLIGSVTNITPDQFVQALDPTDPSGLVSTARNYVTQLGALAAQIPTASSTTPFPDAVAKFAKLKNLPESRLLKPVAKPRFWSAVDPVMVLTGTAHMMSIEVDAALACRWPADVVTALSVPAGGGAPALSISAAQLASVQPPLNAANLPAVVPALYAEAFLLDPTNATLDASAAGLSLNSTQLVALQKNLAAPVAAAGTLPSVLAPPWSQPWQPLYLDWEIEWYPIPFHNSDGGSNWDFNGTDYDFHPGLPAPIAQVAWGRTVLTPKPSFEFLARINQFITNNPGSAATEALQEIENLVQKVDDWDFLSQTFSGLTTMLAGWNPVPTALLPTTPLPGGPQSYADLIGNEAQRPPQPGPTRWRGTPVSTFEGMRAGQFFFSRLTIVDVFGQTLEIVTDQTQTTTSLVPADGLQITAPIFDHNKAGIAQLPPRLLQPARLNFEFVPAANNNPILGWVLPNHIDGGLAVYGADGTLYGELTVATDVANKSYVFWWAAPDTPFPTLTALAAAQAEFGGFLSGLQAAGPVALDNFISAIDETLWTVDPLGDRSDTFLTVLLGRPLAVVAASISFELQSSAWTDPTWPQTFTNPVPGFLNYTFPVQLGNLASRQDGLLGYFEDGNYNTFNAVHVPAPQPGDPPPSGYLSQIGDGNWIKLGFAANGPGPAHSLMLVMDPRAAVHAQCGILPTKDVTLISDWVNTALAAMKATFRTGPILAEMQELIPPGEKTPVPALLLPSPAERRGTWQWRQLAADGSWPANNLAPTDAKAVFPDTPPILRDGVLQLTSGLEM